MEIPENQNFILTLFLHLKNIHFRLMSLLQLYFYLIRWICEIHATWFLKDHPLCMSQSKTFATTIINLICAIKFIVLSSISLLDWFSTARTQNIVRKMLNFSDCVCDECEVKVNVIKNRDSVVFGDFWVDL